jgi:hypothetical protein
MGDVVSFCVLAVVRYKPYASDALHPAMQSNWK